MSSVTEDDVEDSTVDGDEDDDTVISSKHPKSKNPFLISTHVHLPSDVEDSTVDGDEDDDTVISSKHPKSKNPFPYFHACAFTLTVYLTVKLLSLSPSQSKSLSQTNLVHNKKIEQKDSADSVML
eukprot:CAMPEP_0194393898 /NCGR_PEP_ID=MMETSP0174-20130528/123550_1 /TAXON_ID=216777 /ORGANISM="Proboscia alata, Strain PI-D3" /LENGTH=124 /DNA_ID=CAMNT_0039189627 /DNA_START=362 /DNA_END=736 /DNA_ORIENTATION=-